MLNPAMNDNSSDAARKYVQLTLGRTRLLFPSSELLALEATPEIGSAGENGSVGRVRVRDAILPLYNFDEQLHLLHEAQDDRRGCACLGDESKAMGILCDKAEVVDGTGIQMVPLPGCMKSVNTPVQALALQGTRVLCVCTMKDMAGLIEVLLGRGIP